MTKGDTNAALYLLLLLLCVTVIEVEQSSCSYIKLHPFFSCAKLFPIVALHTTKDFTRWWNWL